MRLLFSYPTLRALQGVDILSRAESFLRDPWEIARDVFGTWVRLGSFPQHSVPRAPENGLYQAEEA